VHRLKRNLGKNKSWVCSRFVSITYFFSLIFFPFFFSPFFVFSLLFFSPHFFLIPHYTILSPLFFYPPIYSFNCLNSCFVLIGALDVEGIDILALFWKGRDSVTVVNELKEIKLLLNNWLVWNCVIEDVRVLDEVGNRTERVCQMRMRA
jgi:hypothetical protein